MGLLFQERGNILLGLGRLFSFFCILGLHGYNRRLLRKKAESNANIIPGLVLPYYFSFIYLYIAISLLAGLLDLGITQLDDSDRVHVHNWLIPLEQAVFHWFYEGLAFFLMRYGAGVRAIRLALRRSWVWSAITFLFYFIIFSSLERTFNLDNGLDQVYALAMTYFSILLLFYAAFVVLPERFLHRRSALVFYAQCSAAYYSVSMIFLSVAYYKNRSIICPASIVSFVYVAFLQPWVLFHTLQLDSQYWQGLRPDPRQKHPLGEVWDHLDLETAQTMAEQAEVVSRRSAKHPLPVLPYGLLDFNTDQQFVAGGFSRVYFGRLKGQNVAFKVLFAMELTPSDVEDFYAEALLLHSLAHENIVGCHGICIMPPALTMVLDYCKYGSLFDFLYKATEEEKGGEGIGDDEAGSWFYSRPSSHQRHGQQDDSHPQQVQMQAILNALHDPPPGRPVSISALPLGQRGSTSTSSVRPLSSSTLSTVSQQQNEERSWSQEVQCSSSEDYNTSPRSSSASAPPSASFSAPQQQQQQASRMSLAVRKKVDQVSNIFSFNFNSWRHSFGGDQRPPSQSPAKSITFEQRLLMMRDAVQAIAYLHSRGVMHCDIKSLNYLVDENYRVKLADLGEARPIHGQQIEIRPPIPARNWAPPEVLPSTATAQSYTVHSEVYGLAIVLCELALLELPFGDSCHLMTQSEWHVKLCAGEVSVALPSTLPALLRRTLYQALDIDPMKRPTVQEVLKVMDELIAEHIPSNPAASSAPEEERKKDLD
eukprot:gene4655-5098_t